MTPAVSIVILNWNSAPLVYEAAESAASQQGVDVALVIVDNGSTDGSLAELKRRYPAARFVELGENTGFAAGMNAGLEHAATEFVLLQNADLLLAPDHCVRAVELMRSDSRLGAVGGLVHRLVDGQRSDEYDERGYLLARTFRVAWVRPEEPRVVMGVPGCSPFLRAEAVRDVRRIVGYVLDPWYFAYFEDIDLMLRLNLAGWKVRYEPGIRSWHLKSASMGGETVFHRRPIAAMRANLRNRVATFVKDTPRGVWLWLLPFVLAWHCAVPLYLLVSRPLALGVVLSAWRAVWRERRRLLADRRAIQTAASPQSVERFRSLLA